MQAHSDQTPGLVQRCENIITGLFGKSYTSGHWTRIGPGTRISNGVILGHWSKIGRNCSIGEGTRFGSWARIADDVTLGANVCLGSHTRIQSGVVVQDGTSFEDGDLVTKTGIIPRRCGGFSILQNEDGALVRGAFGRFFIPGDRDQEDISSMVDAYQWGISDELATYRAY